MSDAGDTAEPRRSQREKKKAAQFVSEDSRRNKRKRSDTSNGDEGDSELSELSDLEPDAEDADVEAESDAPTPKAKAKTTKAVPKRKGPPPAKKPKAPAATSSKPKKIVGGRKGKKTAEAATFDAEQVSKDTKISGDNALFNAIMNPAAALQSTAEDFLESLTQTPGASQAELINCVLRTCGCNHAVDADEVVDYDGVVDALDNITEALKQDDTPVYPLTSKLPAFKKFRKSLSEFLSRLISSAAPLGQLYASDLLPTLQTWVVAMSSSHLRAFRHTATVIALEVETALCEVAADVEKEAEVVSRQREGERKRKKGKGEPLTAREKELERKAAEVRERRTKLAEFLKEFVDGVFVHRYRDLDPNIRAECVRAMGQWFAKYPAHFLEGAYLRYVGWVLSDANTHVRLEAVKALALAYEQSEYIGVGALQHFTERFKPRLVEMAMQDTELSVRVAVVQVLQAIDAHGLLEDEHRDKLCLLVFDEEAKMRKAVSGFVKGVWDERVEERLVGRKPNSKEKKRAGVKSFAMLLVQWGRALDKGIVDDEADAEDDGDQSEGSSKRGRGKEVASLVGLDQKGRTTLAVEALWDGVGPVSDWETLLDILLLDHSAGDEESSSQNRSRKKGKQVADSGVEEVWRLEEVEEGVLLEVLLAALRKTKAEAGGSKKGEEDVVSSDITRALIKGLPRLFVKYQTDAGRMSDVLQLPQLMNLDMYLEMRVISAYSTLWDDIIKQFTSHSTPILLTNAVVTIRFMLDATSLANTNSTKILELEEELSTSLRDTIRGRDELELASFSEDEILALAAICARLATLMGTRDMTSWMEEDEGGKQSSAWDIISALAERGRLGYKEEEAMIDQALNLLTLYIIWKARGLTVAPDPSPEELQFREKLKESRDSLLEKLLEFTVGTQSNTSDGVRRAAFQNLMNLHILFCPAQSIAPDGSPLPTAFLALTLEDETQYRCAGFVQAEIERYAEELDELSPPSEEGSDENDSDGQETENEAQPKAKKSKKAKGKQRVRSESPVTSSRSRLEREYVFMGVMATFLRAIRAGAIHFRHSATLLTHYGRLGPSFDLCAKVIVDILREEGMYKDNGEAVVEVILHALRESFMLFLDGVSRSEDHSIALGKLLSSTFIIRGAQLAVVRRLDSLYVVKVHTSAISFICKRIATYEAAGNKKSRNKSVLFFKLLIPLLSSIALRDALTIKSHLDQAIAQAKIVAPPTSRIWDSYRAYEKRLTSSKEKGVSSKKGKKGVKSAEMINTDDEAEAEEVEGLMGEHAGVPNKPRRRPRAAHRSARAIDSGTEGETDVRDEDENPFLDHAQVTPKQRPRPRPRPAYKANSPNGTQSKASTPPRTQSPELGGSTSLSEPPMTPEPLRTPEPEVYATPVASRKRGRSPDVGEDEDEVMSVNGLPNSEEAASPAQPSASQETNISEIQIRRKRIRH